MPTPQQLAKRAAELLDAIEDQAASDIQAVYPRGSIPPATLAELIEERAKRLLEAAAVDAQHALATAHADIRL